MIEGYRKYYKPQKRYHTGLPKKIIENVKDNKVAITEPFTDFGTFSLVHQYLKFYLIKHIFKEMKILLILGIFGFCALLCFYLWKCPIRKSEWVIKVMFCHFTMMSSDTGDILQIVSKFWLCYSWVMGEDRFSCPKLKPKPTR